MPHKSTRAIVACRVGDERELLSVFVRDHIPGCDRISYHRRPRRRSTEDYSDICTWYFQVRDKSTTVDSTYAFGDIWE